MPLALVNRLGPNVSGITGAWIPTSETLLEAQGAAGAARRFITAQVSDLYLVTVWMQTTSNATAGAVMPRIDYFSYIHGSGKAVSITPALSFAATDASGDFTSSAIIPILAAASDIFISWAMNANGALPIVDLYFRISRSI